MNILKIKIRDNNISLILENGRRVLDEFKWEDENNLSRDLLAKIDQMLSKNEIEAEDVKLEVDSDMSERFTTRRIAEAVANAWNF